MKDLLWRIAHARALGGLAWFRTSARLWLHGWRVEVFQDQITVTGRARGSIDSIDIEGTIEI